MERIVTITGEVVGLLLVAMLVTLDLRRGLSRRRVLTMVALSAVLFGAFAGLVVTRFALVVR